MARTQVFRFRVNQEERQLISALADYLNRSQGDAIRLLIRGAVNELELSQKRLIEEEKNENQM